MEIREMQITDYEQVILLWQNCEGVGLHDDVDSRKSISLYLARNPGLSFVAIENNKIIGAVLDTVNTLSP